MSESDHETSIHDASEWNKKKNCIVVNPERFCQRATSKLMFLLKHESKCT